MNVLPIFRQLIDPLATVIAATTTTTSSSSSLLLATFMASASSQLHGAIIMTITNNPVINCKMAKHHEVNYIMMSTSPSLVNASPGSMRRPLDMLVTIYGLFVLEGRSVMAHATNMQTEGGAGGVFTCCSLAAKK